MPNVSTPTNPKLDASVRAALDSLRGRIRCYAGLQGLGAAAACLGAAFWLSLAADWFFEPAVAVRVMGLLATLVALGAVVVNRIVRRLMVPLPDESMAMLLERRFTQLDDALLTAVSLAGEKVAGDRLEVVLLAHTRREAAARIEGLPLDQVFNPRPLSCALTAGALFLLSIVLFGLAAPGSLATWSRRCLLLSEQPWPRKTRLGVEGFEKGVVKIARGADVEIVATADLDMPRIPKTVELRFQTENGVSGRELMTREGVGVPGRDRVQQYTHVFRGVLSSIEFDLVGGDDRIDSLRIEVVESPKIDELSVRCEYPAYMAREPRVLPVVGVMQIPQNSRITIEGRANKPLAQVSVENVSEDSGKPVTLEPSDAATQRRSFRYEFGKLDKDATLLITPRDADGIVAAEPTRLVLAAAADQPPELSVALSGIGTAITPKANVPIVGHARDDCGIGKIWFEYAVDKSKPSSLDIASPEGNPTEIRMDSALDVRDLKLAPGRKLLIGLKASDRCDLPTSSHVGASQRWQLDVVSPEQLRAMLEARELTLRYRFEQIKQEVVETGESLALISFGVEKASKENKATEPGGVDRRRAGLEPGETLEERPKESSTEVLERQRAAASMGCERAIQNGRKNAGETLGVAESFDDIRLQLVNNRLDTEELKNRLKSGIADPLRKIGEKMFPELDARLLALRDALGDQRRGPALRDAAKKQLDDILLAMNEALSRMMEMEDFNKATSLMREIIDLQKELESKTRQRQKDRLKGLLEED